MKSGTASGCAALTAAGKAAQPDAKGRFFISERQGARRKMGDIMIPARRENAVLAHPRANLNSHFARNGCKRAFKTFKGERGRLGRESGARSRWRRLYGGVNLGS